MIIKNFDLCVCGHTADQHAKINQIAKTHFCLMCTINVIEGHLEKGCDEFKLDNLEYCKRIHEENLNVGL